MINLVLALRHPVEKHTKKILYSFIEEELLNQYFSLIAFYELLRALSYVKYFLTYIFCSYEVYKRFDFDDDYSDYYDDAAADDKDDDDYHYF